MNKNNKIVIIRVTPEIKRALKMLAVQRDNSIQKILLELIELELKNNA